MDNNQETINLGELASKEKSNASATSSSTITSSASKSQQQKVRAIIQNQPTPKYGMGSVGIAPNYSKIPAIKLKDETKILDSLLNNDDLTAEDRYKIARNLVEIYDELMDRSTEQKYSDNPDYSNDIWQIYGGPGDPLIGDLYDFGIFRKIDKWKTVAKEYGPEGWSGKILNKAYTANSKKRARATNFGTSIEDARKNIGKTSKLKNDWAPALQAASEWNPNNKNILINPHFDMTADEAISILGPNNSLSEGENLIHKMLAHKKSSLTLDQVKTKITSYIEDHIKPAFRIAKIDTIQAQAAYLAHWAGETKFGLFTESQNEVFEDDPHAITYNSGYGGSYDYARAHKNRTGNPELDKKIFSKDLSQKTYSVDPLGVIESKQAMRGKTQPEAAAIMNNTFVGRGAVQVTHDSNYTMALVYLEEILKTTTNQEDRALIKEALFKIKQDPSQAANPEYAFLFSAAYMHTSGGVRDTSKLGHSVSELNFSGYRMTNEQQNLFRWVSGGLDIVKFARRSKGSVARSVEDAAKTKVQAYNNAFKTLEKKLKKRNEKERIKRKQRQLEQEKNRSKKQSPDRWPFREV